MIHPSPILVLDRLRLSAVLAPSFVYSHAVVVGEREEGRGERSEVLVKLHKKKGGGGGERERQTDRAGLCFLNGQEHPRKGRCSVYIS